MRGPGWAGDTYFELRRRAVVRDAAGFRAGLAGAFFAAAGFAFEAAVRVRDAAGFALAELVFAAGFAFDAAFGFAAAALVRDAAGLAFAAAGFALDAAFGFAAAALVRDAAGFAFAAAFAAAGFAFDAAAFGFAAAAFVRDAAGFALAAAFDEAGFAFDAAGLAFAAAVREPTAFLLCAEPVLLAPELLLDELRLDALLAVLDERDDDRVAAGTTRDLESIESPSGLGPGDIENLLFRLRTWAVPTRVPFYPAGRTTPARTPRARGVRDPPIGSAWIQAQSIG